LIQERFQKARSFVFIRFLSVPSAKASFPSKSTWRSRARRPSAIAKDTCTPDPPSGRASCLTLAKR
jgi:hypothetical protein